MKEGSQRRKLEKEVKEGKKEGKEVKIARRESRKDVEEGRKEGKEERKEK